jgi:hypothetical protein
MGRERLRREIWLVAEDVTFLVTRQPPTWGRDGFATTFHGTYD